MCLDGIPFYFPLNLLGQLPTWVVGCAPYTFLLRIALACVVVLAALTIIAFAQMGRSWLAWVDLAATVGAGVLTWVASQQGFVPLVYTGGKSLPQPEHVLRQLIREGVALSRVSVLVALLCIVTAFLVLLTMGVLVWARRRRHMRTTVAPPG